MTTPPSRPSAIETTSLTKRYGDQVAVDSLSLCVPTGTVFGFIGPNGAGKTTTIRMLMNTLRSTAGSARLLGLDVACHRAELRRRIGYVPELHFIYRWMRVSDALWFCRSLHRTWNDRRCRELLDIFELDPNKCVRQLSKGMVAKLALLLAVAHEPELLILDEPTSGLDPLVREEFLDGVLRTVCTGDLTVLFSSHVMSDVQRLADRIGIICGGRMLVDSRTDELVAGTKRVRAVVSNDTPLERLPAGTIWHTVRHREWLFTVHRFSPATIDELRNSYPVENLEVHDLALEDIFKDFVKGRRGAA